MNSDNFKINLYLRDAIINKKRTAIIILILLIGSCLFLYYENNHIVISKYSYTNEKVPSSFENLKILQISDFHNAEFGKNQNIAIKNIRQCEPDIIVITGDLIDRRKYDLEKSMNLVKQIVNVAPVYYVSGNHEAWSGHYDEVKKALLNENVKVLDNDSVEIQKGKDSITLMGVKDPDFLTSNYIDGTNYSELEKYLDSVSKDNKFEILLSHRPELMWLYKKYNIDLVFTGHVHGGQIRLPFVGGIIGPDQGFFPKYDAGKFVEGDTTMILSRGLGNSVFPFRIFNPPELVLVELGK
ncbi:metallophosphoesterase [Terrisporobacter vanillatitrophus]|uniref:metallophosphoesterase n=1 Tax=Terrisporobacter vanillatitrophus TaxID=3058402 RepID=UPI003367C4A6